MKLYDKIKSLLTHNPLLRDSDKRLQWSVWQMQGYVSNNVLTYDSFMTGKLINPETIRRTRQMVQADNKNLQSSEGIQVLRNKRRKSKGTYVFREQLNYRYEGNTAIQI